MALIEYPDVPQVAGVPDVKRSASNTGTTDSSSVVSTSITLPAEVTYRWGIYDSSNNVIGDSSTLVFSIRAESQIASHPTEKGGFASYNKVDRPKRPIVTLAVSGAASDRAQFLVALESARKSTNLYSVVMPEYTYTNCSLLNYEIRRSADKGANMLIIDVQLEESRIVSPAYSSKSITDPTDSQSTSTVNSGKVSATTSDSSVTSAAASKVK